MSFINKMNYLSISHGINIQVLAHITAIGSYSKFSRMHIIMLVIILFVATSWSDISTFYNDENINTDGSLLNKTYLLFITEFFVILLLLLPIFTISNKFLGIILSYILSFFLLFINNKFFLNYSNEKNAQITCLSSIISYILY